MKHPLTYLVSATVTMILAVVFMSSLASVANAQLQGDLPPTGSGSQGSCTNLSSNFGFGASSSDVATLQNYLSLTGYFTTEATGYFGNVTVNAVKNYQTAHNLQGTGYVGPLTRAAIQTESCNSSSGAQQNQSTPSFICPVGWNCVPNTPPVSTFTCPTGWVCTPNSSSGSTVSTGSTGTTGGTRTSTYTPGAYSGQQTSNTSNTGQNVTVAQIQALAQSQGRTLTAAETQLIQSLSGTAGTGTTGTTAAAASNTAADGTIAIPAGATTVTETADPAVELTSAAAIPGSYQISVNYSQPLEDMIVAYSPAKVSNDILMGMFSSSGRTGQVNATAKVFTVGELLPNAVSTGTQKCDAYGRNCQTVLSYKGIKYDDLAASLKAKGFRFATIQELLALAKTNPQTTGVAFGSAVRSSKTIAYDYYVTTLSKPILMAPYINATRQIGYGSVTNVDGILTLRGQSAAILSEPVIAVQDSTWTPALFSSLPASDPPTTAYVAGTSYGIPSLPYTVQVNYSLHSSYRNDFTGSGTATKTMKLLTIKGTSGARTSMSQVKSFMPAGYRVATAAEMVALDAQYPRAAGNKGMMAYGSYNDKCQANPFLHPRDGWAQGPNGTRYFDDRRYFNPGLMEMGKPLSTYTTSNPDGFSPKIGEMLFPIVKI